jgi:hypothetical protein
MLQTSPHPRRTTPRRSSASRVHEAYPFPSPVRGINTAQPLPGGNPLTAIRLENWLPRDLGCQMRRGFRRWVSNMGNEIRSLMQYHPPSGAAKLFASNDAGDVFDVTVAQPSAGVPVPVLTVAGGQPPGEWTSLNFVTDAGVHYLVAVNPGGGLWVYDGAAWTEITAGAGPFQIDGVDPHSFNFVAVYKKSLIFGQIDSTKMWYLPVGQIAGVALPFDFGALFPNGGAIASLINWTFDGSAATGGGAAGGGLDNKLVIVSDQGDVLVYSGPLFATEPSFVLSGRWYIGQVPIGHRFAIAFGSDVVILSERGLCFMTELMRGEGFFARAEGASAVNDDVAKQVSTTISVRYWELEFLPHEQLLVIKPPKYNAIDRQWAYEVNNKAFTTLLGIPMVTVEPFNGRSYSGDYAGNVWLLFEGQSDGEVDGVPGKTLEANVVTAFQPLGDGVRQKRFLMVKPSFIAAVAPGVISRLNPEWNLGLPGSAPVFIDGTEALWDDPDAVWDAAVWAGSDNSFEAWAGAVGTGRYGSLAMRVRGAADTIFVGWQAVVEPGGIL